MIVKSVKYNWHQNGSLSDNNGAGEDWTKCEVGVKGVILIEENEPLNGFQLWNYMIHLEGGTKYRVFNPNFVEYFAS